MQGSYLARPLSALLAISALLTGCSPEAEYDLILSGGTIFDGSGAAAFVGDLAIVGDEIVAVGQLREASAREVIDVSGLAVAPGFLNIHSHADANALSTAVNMLSQGVTTEIMNSDGVGPLDLTAQFSAYAEAGLALNVGGFIGFNSVWREVMGLDDIRPTQQQIAQMQALIEAGLNAGAWGVSSGLDYVPGYYAEAADVIEILRPFASWDVVFTNHDRVTPESGFSSLEGMTETVEIGEASGLIPVVTHMKVQGWEQGQAQVILDRMRKADTDFPGGAAADVYPYLAGATSLAALIIPSWAQEGGRDTMLERFGNPELRARIAQEAEEAISLRFGGAEGVYLLSEQRELTAAMDDLGTRSAAEAVIRLLEQANRPVILRFGAEPDLIEIMQHGTTSIACDCGASLRDPTHPRYWGSYPKILGEYVREKGALTLPEAIYKMTALPAQIIGMNDRGLIKPGMTADLVVFDSDTVIDHATYSESTLMSDGIAHTFVNGQLAWSNGAGTGVMSGRSLQRTLPE